MLATPAAAPGLAAERMAQAQLAIFVAVITTLVGALLAVLYLRAGIGPGLLLAVILLAAPISFLLAFDPAGVLRKYPGGTVAIGFLSVWLMRLMPSIRYPHVFGGTDATYTYTALTSAFSGDGRFDLASLHTETFRFGGLFAAYRLLERGFGVSPELIALWIHPTLNALVMLLVVAIAQQLVSFRLAMIGGLIFGWDLIAVRLGAELRQEALGIVFYAGILLCVMLGLGQQRQATEYRLIGVILLAAVILSHFVSSAHTVGMLIITALIAAVLPKFRIVDATSSRAFSNLAILALVGLLGYLIYAAQKLDFAVTFITRVVAELARPYGSVATPSNQGLGLLQYGLLVAIVSWAGRALLGIGVIWLAVSLRRLRTNHLPFGLILMLTLIYTGLSLVSSVLPMGLNPWRFYHFWLIPASIVMVLGMRWVRGIKAIRRARWLLLLFMCAYAVSTLIRFPQYLIGDVHGLRGRALIDELRQDYTTDDLTASDYVKDFLPGVELAGMTDDGPAFGGLTNRGFITLQSADGTIGVAPRKQPVSAIGVRTVSERDGELAPLTVWAQTKIYSSPSTAIYGYITPIAADDNISPAPGLP